MKSLVIFISFLIYQICFSFTFEEITVDFYSITEINQTLYIGGQDGKLIYSKDNGASWSRLQTGFVKDIYSLDVYNNQVWGCGEDGLVFKIDDQNKIQVIKINTKDKLELIAKNNDLIAIASIGGNIFVSNNGKEWSVFDSHIQIKDLVLNEENGLILISDNYILSKEYESDKFKTDIFLPKTNFQKINVFEKSVIVISNDTLAISYDNGISWSFKDLIVHGEIYDMHYKNIDEVILICSSPNHSIYSTYLVSWNKNSDEAIASPFLQDKLPYTGREPLGKSVTHINIQNEIYCVGANNMILKGIEYGKNWEILSLFNYENFKHDLSINDKIMLFCSQYDYNRYFKSTDSGITWKPGIVNIENQLVELVSCYVYNDDDYILIDKNGLIFNRFDGSNILNTTKSELRDNTIFYSISEVVSWEHTGWPGLGLGCLVKSTLDTFNTENYKFYPKHTIFDFESIDIELQYFLSAYETDKDITPYYKRTPPHFVKIDLKNQISDSSNLQFLFDIPTALSFFDSDEGFI